MLNDTDRDAIAAAVARAEASTSGEIVCVLARRVADYGATPLLWAAGVALLAPLLALTLGLDPAALPQPGGGWAAGHSSAAPASRGAAITAYVLAQGVLFLLVLMAASLPPLRMILTPPWVKARRVRQAAMAQLAAATLSAGASRAAVVIFAAEAEHRVEVLASEAAHAAVGQPVWDQAVAAVLAGMKRDTPAEGVTAAVALCGEALARCFPQSSPDENALPDQPLEL